MIRKLKNEQAVSPVIGTILLVALTVVLIAIITAVVMGLANQPAAKEVGLTVEYRVNNATNPVDASDRLPPGNTPLHPILTVIVYGGKDVTDLRYLNVTVEGAEATVFYGTDNSKIYWYGGFYTNVQTPYRISSSDIIGKPLNYLSLPVAGPLGYYIQSSDHSDEAKSAWRNYSNVLVTVTGTFSDGTSQVLLQKRMDISPVPEEYQKTAYGIYDGVKNNPELYWYSPMIV